MKKNKLNILCLFLLLAFMSNSIFAQKRSLDNIDNLDKLNRKFINSFKKQNFDILYEMFPPKEVVVGFFEQRLPDTPKRDTVLQNIQKLYTQKYYTFYKAEFERIIKLGKQMDIDWMRLKYVGSEYEIQKEGDFLVANPTFIKTKHRQTFYEVVINAVKLEDSWYVLPMVDNRAMISKLADPKRKKKKKDKAIDSPTE